jgi:hypothetical protein
MSFSTKEVSGGYFELTKKIAKLEQIIIRILKKLKLHVSYSETEIDQQTSSIEYHKETIKVLEELNIKEKLNSILENLSDQLSSIEIISIE